METQGINLFIVDDNQLLAADLKIFLQNKFGSDLIITTFQDGDSCLKNIDCSIHIVILDYFMEGKNGLEILQAIKSINPKTEVIILSTNDDIAIAIETFRAGARDYVVKGDGAWKKVMKIVDIIITKPIRVIVKGFLK
jgi:DNA-binding NarL/FixJ family response regulator